MRINKTFAGFQVLGGWGSPHFQVHPGSCNGLAGKVIAEPTWQPEFDSQSPDHTWYSTHGEAPTSCVRRGMVRLCKAVPRMCAVTVCPPQCAHLSACLSLSCPVLGLKQLAPSTLQMVPLLCIEIYLALDFKRTKKQFRWGGEGRGGEVLSRAFSSRTLQLLQICTE